MRRFEPICARGREKKCSPMVLWYSQAIDALILLPSVLQQYLRMKSSFPLNNNNTWGYLFSERIMIPWCHAGCDLKRLGWHNCYHLRDAQTFLRLVWCWGNNNHPRHHDHTHIHTHTHRMKRPNPSILVWNVTNARTNDLHADIVFFQPPVGSRSGSKWPEHNQQLYRTGSCSPWDRSLCQMLSY